MSVPPSRHPASEPRLDISAPPRPEVEHERYELDEAAPYRFELQRREFLATLGGGLLVAIIAPAAGAQPQSGRAGREVPSDIEAWLHLDERGHVTGYTGKVEVGQHIRTSLAQTIADELRVPFERVALVMGDTDRTPYDAGTFGSQSTPRMAPLLARAAATTREMLIDEAASRWGIDRTAVTAHDGRLHGPADRSLGYGELVKERALTGAVHADAPLSPPERWHLRGTSVRHPDGAAVVTGRHVYPSDLARPRMLHGRVVRPPAMGATLASMDDSVVRGRPGVVVVRDGDFVGVVAPTERDAVAAASAIEVEWRRLEGQPSSETIYGHLRQHAGDADGRGRPAAHEAGDVQRGRAGAAQVVEATYRIPYIAHVPLEPRAAVAEWQGDRLTVWTGTQRPFGVRTQLAEAFRLAEAHVRVVMPDTGSAYGGKHTGEHAVEAARLARAARQPVRLAWTRAEEFAWGYLRPAGVIDVRAGLDAEGRMVSWEFDNWNSGGAAIRTPYDVPHQRIAFHPSQSPLRQGSYRALAATANHYAREMHMDALARAAGSDPVAFRLAHTSNERLRDVLMAAAERAGWPRPSADGRALGIACGTEKGSYIATAAELSRTGEGFRVERLVVAFECGAIVNPDGVRNQVEGCVVQGLGGALFEAIAFEDGRILNGTFGRYRVPRFQDVPLIDIVLLDRRDLASAGAGETPIVCVAPAIGSAARALGEVAPELPVRLVNPAQSRRG